nr:unnamed protein product [Naegleria fowleri]
MSSLLRLNDVVDPCGRRSIPSIDYHFSSHSVSNSCNSSGTTNPHTSLKSNTHDHQSNRNLSSTIGPVPALSSTVLDSIRSHSNTVRNNNNNNHSCSAVGMTNAVPQQQQPLSSLPPPDAFNVSARSGQTKQDSSQIQSSNHMRNLYQHPFRDESSPTTQVVTVCHHIPQIIQVNGGESQQFSKSLQKAPQRTTIASNSLNQNSNQTLMTSMASTTCSPTTNTTTVHEVHSNPSSSSLSSLNSTRTTTIQHPNTRNNKSMVHSRSVVIQTPHPPLTSKKKATNSNFGPPYPLRRRSSHSQQVFVRSKHSIQSSRHSDSPTIRQVQQERNSASFSSSISSSTTSSSCSISPPFNVNGTTTSCCCNSSSSNSDRLIQGLTKDACASHTSSSSSLTDESSSHSVSYLCHEEDDHVRRNVSSSTSTSTDHHHSGHSDSSSSQSNNNNNTSSCPNHGSPNHHHNTRHYTFITFEELIKSTKQPRMKPSSISKAEMLRVLRFPQTLACKFIGCSLSTLKRRFYELKHEFGLMRWPQSLYEMKHLDIYPQVHPMSLAFILNEEEETLNSASEFVRMNPTQ